MVCLSPCTLRGGGVLAAAASFFLHKFKLDFFSF
jgi:hypothetical protein